MPKPEWSGGPSVSMKRTRIAEPSAPLKKARVVEPSAAIEELPTEILELVISYLDAPAVVALRHASPLFHERINLKKVLGSKSAADGMIYQRLALDSLAVKSLLASNVAGRAVSPNSTQRVYISDLIGPKVIEHVEKTMPARSRAYFEFGGAVACGGIVYLEAFASSWEVAKRHFWRWLKYGIIVRPRYSRLICDSGNIFVIRCLRHGTYNYNYISSKEPDKESYLSRPDLHPTDAVLDAGVLADGRVCVVWKNSQGEIVASGVEGGGTVATGDFISNGAVDYIDIPK